MKPEGEMKQRNNYLPGLNANLATLFNRTDVSTFAGTSVSTPLRFYVHGWQWCNSIHLVAELGRRHPQLGAGAAVPGGRRRHGAHLQRQANRGARD